MQTLTRYAKPYTKVIKPERKPANQHVSVNARCRVFPVFFPRSFPSGKCQAQDFGEFWRGSPAQGDPYSRDGLALRKGRRCANSGVGATAGSAAARKPEGANGEAKLWRALVGVTSPKGDLPPKPRHPRLLLRGEGGDDRGLCSHPASPALPLVLGEWPCENPEE